jgi:hypothetical protein
MKPKRVGVGFVEQVKAFTTADTENTEGAQRKTISNLHRERPFQI